MIELRLSLNRIRLNVGSGRSDLGYARSPRCHNERFTQSLLKGSVVSQLSMSILIPSNKILMVKKMGLNGEDYSGKYPRLKYYGSYYSLKNGNFIIYYQNMAGIAADQYSNEAYNTAMNGCELMVCLSPEGETKWTKFIYSQGNHKNYGMTLTDDDKLIYITHGMEANYPNGEFEFNTREGINNKFVYNYIDLSNGETLARKTFEEKAFNREHTRVLTAFNQKAQKYSFGLQSNSGAGLGRKAAIAIVAVSQD